MMTDTTLERGGPFWLMVSEREFGTSERAGQWRVECVVPIMAASNEFEPQHGAYSCDSHLPVRPIFLIIQGGSYYYFLPFCR